MLNEKGMTMIELLIAIAILISILTASLRFYENYAYESSEFGEYLTAKHLTVKALEIARGNYIDNVRMPSLVVYEDIERINGVNFQSTVTQLEVTEIVGVISQDVEMVKLTATTSWKSKNMEVSAYVSSP